MSARPLLFTLQLTTMAKNRKKIPSDDPFTHAEQQSAEQNINDYVLGVPAAPRTPKPEKPEKFTEEDEDLNRWNTQEYKDENGF